MPSAPRRWHKPLSLAERRYLHSGSWWLWAIFLAAMAAGTTNPIFLISIIIVALLVVKYRKSDAPWSKSIKGYLIAACFVLVIRILLVVITPDIFGDTLLFTLPKIELPSVFAGVKLGGEIKANTVYFAFQEGLRFATILVCIGAAQSLASPTRLLKSIPAALYEVGLAIVVALTFAPQLAFDAKRVRDAQYLRGRKTKGIRALAKTFVPVLEGAMERALQLAAAMDSRGYGRKVHLTRNIRLLNNSLILIGLLGILLGLAGLLGVFSQSNVGGLTLLLGVSLSFTALWFAGKNASRTNYRPDKWHIPEVLVVTSSLFGLVSMRLTENIVLNPVTSPLSFPQINYVTLISIWVSLFAIYFSPLPPQGNSTVTQIYRSKIMSQRDAA